MTQPAWMETIFDRTPHLPNGGPVDPVVHDASHAALRQRTVNFAAKRYADMMFISGLDRATADRNFRLRVAQSPSGLRAHAAGAAIQAEADAAFAAGRIVIHTDAADRRATVRWGDTVGHALSRPGYGSILLGPNLSPGFDPRPIGRHQPDAGLAWPRGDAVDPKDPPPALAEALDAFFAGSPGLYGVLVASPRAGADRALQRFWKVGPGDAKLVDDQGNHLHGYWPHDP